MIWPNTSFSRLVDLASLKVEHALGDWLAQQHDPVRGVFMTHLHVDHLAGMRDAPNEAAVYAGPGETSDRDWKNLLVEPIAKEALAGKGPLRTWEFKPDPSGRFDGGLDVFGDQMVWALLVTGHTVGSTAYLIRTPKGPVLLTGDACHTAWGWEHGVEPGSFSRDRAKSAESLRALESFVKAHPEVDVRLGHQALERE